MATMQKTRGRSAANGHTIRQNGDGPTTNKSGNGKSGHKTTDGRLSHKTGGRSDTSAGARPDASTAARSNAKDAGHQDKSNASMVNYLEKFLLSQLSDIYAAEKKIIESLPKMVEAATTEILKEAFEDHLHQTERHKRRLEKIFMLLGHTPEEKTCQAIEGIVAEAEEIIRETETGTMTRDAALIIAAQKVEHYEIATYGGLVELAMTMQLDEVAGLLDRTLVEEEDTDGLLTDIAESEINLGSEHESFVYSWAEIVI